MNCKPGDMAIIVKCCHESENNLGKIITVHSLSGLIYGTGPAWKYEPLLFTKKGVLIAAAEDAALLPIRPGDLHETEDDLNEVSA